MRSTDVDDAYIVPMTHICFLVGLVGGVPGGSLKPGAPLPVTVSRSGGVKGLRASQLQGAEKGVVLCATVGAKTSSRVDL